MEWPRKEVRIPVVGAQSTVVCGRNRSPLVAPSSAGDGNSAFPDVCGSYTQSCSCPRIAATAFRMVDKARLVQLWGWGIHLVFTLRTRISSHENGMRKKELERKVQNKGHTTR